MEVVLESEVIENNIWRYGTIKDNCLVGDGLHGKVKRVKDGVLYLSAKNLKDSNLNLIKVDYISEEDYRKHFKDDSKALTKPKADDVIFGIIGTIGEPYLVRNNDRFGLSSSVAILRPDTNYLLPKYLYYWIKSPTFQQALYSFKGGVAQGYLSLEMIKSLPLYYPPLPTQQKIASILSTYDDLIENNTRRIAILEEMAQNIYREWFVNFRYPGHENVPLVNSSLGPIPQGWEMKKLGDVADEVRRSVNISKLDPETPYVGLEHIPRKSIALTEWGKAEEIQSSKLAFKKGEILFGKIRPYFHKVCVAPMDGICSTDTIVIVPKEHNLFSLILSVVFSENFVAYATQTSQGTKMPRANWKLLTQYPIIVPPNFLLNEFNTILFYLVQLQRSLIFKNKNLCKTRDLLLPKLISGYLEVERVRLEIQ